MKKYICLLLVIVLCFGVVGCGDTQQTQSAETGEPASDNQTVESGGESETNYVFRYANWGDDIETVAKREPRPCDYQAEFTLDYNDTELFGYTADASYFFFEDGFDNGCYSINNTYDIPEMYNTDFNNIDKSLIEEYGQPMLENETEWKESVLSVYESISQFDVICYSFWEKPNVIVLHMLYNARSNIMHDIIYIDPNSKLETTN